MNFECGLFHLHHDPVGSKWAQKVENDGILTTGSPDDTCNAFTQFVVALQNSVFSVVGQYAGAHTLSEL